MEPFEGGMQPARLQDTAFLIRHAKAGDDKARDSLFLQYYPHLLIFMHNRLTGWGRRLRETQDLVHEVYVHALPRLGHFEYRGIGAFWAFLRQIALNHVRKIGAGRGCDARTVRMTNDSRSVPKTPGPSPPELLLNKEESEAFERSLDLLQTKEKEALLLRLELGLSYQAIADMLDYPSRDAARMSIVRASKKVYQEIHRGIAAL